METQSLIPESGSKVKLADYNADFVGGYDKESAKVERAPLEERLDVLQEILYAQGAKALLIVLQGMDTAGKDGTIKKVFEVVNPQGISVTSFKAPTENELARDFLWRVHALVPPKGQIGIFNRSHYEDVLVVRVEKLAPREVWQARYEHINNFEKLLADTGTHVLKFFLHISRDEQRRRLEARLQNSNKTWKFNKDDLKAREKWDDYHDAYEDVFRLTNTPNAPWHIVPANNKWYRNLVITRAIVEAMESMDLAFPKPEKNLDDVEIPE